MASEPLIIVTEPLTPDALEWLQERATVRRIPSEDPAFEAALATAEGLVVRTYTQVDGALRYWLPELQFPQVDHHPVTRLSTTQAFNRRIDFANSRSQLFVTIDVPLNRLHDAFDCIDLRLEVFPKSSRQIRAVINFFQSRLGQI